MLRILVLKDDRIGGEKNRRIELGRWVRKIHGKTMEIRERDEHEHKVSNQ